MLANIWTRLLYCYPYILACRSETAIIRDFVWVERALVGTSQIVAVVSLGAMGTGSVG